jgi:hypothetical protein
MRLEQQREVRGSGTEAEATQLADIVDEHCINLAMEAREALIRARGWNPPQVDHDQK